MKEIMDLIVPLIKRYGIVLVLVGIGIGVMVAYTQAKIKKEKSGVEIKK